MQLLFDFCICITIILLQQFFYYYFSDLEIVKYLFKHMEKTWIEKQFRNNPTIEFCLDESRRIHEIFHQTPLHLAAKEVSNFFLIYFRHF